MNSLVALTTDGNVAHLGSIVDRKTMRPLKDAADIMAAARKAAAALEASAVEAAQAAHDAGHAAGFEAGRRAGMVSVLGTLLVERRLRDVLTTRLVQLVESAARVLLGEMPHDELAQRRIHALVASPTAQAAGARLHVPPQHVQTAVRSIAAIGTAMGTEAAWLAVIADESLSPHDAVLESDAGFIEARLELQFDELRKILEDVLARALLSMQVQAP